MIDSNANTTNDNRNPLVPTGDNQRQSSMADLLSTNKWIQLLEILIVFSPGLIVIITAQWINFENPMLLIAAIWFANVVMMGLVWLGIWLRQESWNSIGLSVGPTSYANIGWTFLKSLLILLFVIVAFVFGAIVMANIVGIPEDADMSKYNYIRGNLPMLLISLVGVYFVSSLGEEVVYRGFLMTRLQTIFGGNQWLPIVGAVVVSSIIFGFAHYEWGAMGIGQTTCMGAALAVSFLWTKRNLWPLILTHVIMDTLLLVPLYFAPEVVS